ncbi:hypothetical protein RHMOL_Rhmol03G0038300 [Rhododendron molle]|uniref:Uncharacterized protein n=1 Tax=Rhododendron molle TaxID=49168 RepID=A0ACC0PCL1_RHOML|nr:hypothetical protein RHMOL_Rhmol03G0038300 [Rhododendron molle]
MVASNSPSNYLLLLLLVIVVATASVAQATITISGIQYIQRGHRRWRFCPSGQPNRRRCRSRHKLIMRRRGDHHRYSSFNRPHRSL